MFKWFWTIFSLGAPEDSFFYFPGREPQTTIESLSDLHQQLNRKVI